MVTMIDFGWVYIITCLFFVAQCDHQFSDLLRSTNDSNGPDSFDFDAFDLEERADVFWESDNDDTLLRGGSGPVVTTDCGVFEGRYGGGKVCKYDKFLGIRYAQPPVGTFRFEMAFPRACDSNGTYEATEFCPPCMQPKGKALKTSRKMPSEDCLCLNIYRPPNCNSKSKKPVLIYLHESYYLYGSASQPELNGGCLADLGDIIVVTINYRLGAFGWLYSGVADTIPGDMAQTDVVEAIKFVKENIQYFGGDPKLITVGGHGAGGVMAAELLFDYLLPDDLFQGIMVMSPYFNPQTYYDSAFVTLQKSNIFLKCIDCDDGSDKNQIFTPAEESCAKSADADKIADASDDISYDDANGICSINQLTLAYMRISVDDRLQRYMFFKDKHIFLGGVPTEFKKSLIGSKAETKDEAAGIIAEKVKPVIFDRDWENVQAIVDYYLSFILSEDPATVGRQATQALNNLCFNCPLTELANYVSPFNELYAYQFEYVASMYHEDPKRCYGAYHLDDVPFGFGEPFRVWSEYTDYDREVSRELIHTWSDFVHQNKMKWPRYDQKDRWVGIIKGAKDVNYHEPNSLTKICERLDA